MADVSDVARYKNRLQELMQKSKLDIPVYVSVPQGVQPEFGFRPSVVVDKVLYTSEKRFPTKKAAEQYIAMVAFEGASQKIKDDALSIINKEPRFCKEIVYEYAAKMNMEKPIFHTVQVVEGALPRFTSSLVFNMVKYTGEVGRTKKDSEQLAARAVIISTLGRSDTGIMMSLLINSKFTNKGINLPNIVPHVVAEVVVAESVDPDQNNLATLSQTVTSSPLVVNGSGAPVTRKRSKNNNTKRKKKTMRINIDQVDSSNQESMEVGARPRSVAEIEIGQVPANVVVDLNVTPC